jgi:hypothetical protein
MGKLRWSPSRGDALRTHPLPQPTASSLVVDRLFLHYTHPQHCASNLNAIHWDQLDLLTSKLFMWLGCAMSSSTSTTRITYILGSAGAT